MLILCYFFEGPLIGNQGMNGCILIIAQQAAIYLNTALRIPTR